MTDKIRDQQAGAQADVCDPGGDIALPLPNDLPGRRVDYQAQITLLQARIDRVADVAFGIAEKVAQLNAKVAELEAEKKEREYR